MKLDIAKISGVGEFSSEKIAGKNERDSRVVYKVAENKKVFLVESYFGEEIRTIEVRCDRKLGNFLQEKYETVMESRYFGVGGIEIVPSGQIAEEEIVDLIRLSYNLTKDLAEEA